MTEEIPYAALNRVLVCCICSCISGHDNQNIHNKNNMAAHRDRKLIKATVLTSFDPATFQHLFNEYAKLTRELPKTKESAIIFDFRSSKRIPSSPVSGTAFGDCER
jgi:hypothetical protein